MQVCESPQKTCRPGRKTTEDDAPHSTERIDVVHRAMRHRVAVEGLRHIRKPMRLQARKGNPGQCEGVDPVVGYLLASGDLLDEGSVEDGVVRKDGHSPDELRQACHGLLGAGGIYHV